MPPTRSQSFIGILSPNGFGVERFTCKTHWWPLPSGCAFHRPGHHFSDMSVNGFLHLRGDAGGRFYVHKGYTGLCLNCSLGSLGFFIMALGITTSGYLQSHTLGWQWDEWKVPLLMWKTIIKKYHRKNITSTSLGALLPEARPLLKDQTTYSEFAKNSTPSTWKVAGINP